MRKHTRRLVAALVGAILPLSLLPAVAGAVTTLPYEVVVDGLENPRHITVGPDGALYVAEAGMGGDDCHEITMEHDGEEFTATLCFGDSGAITRIDPETGDSERWFEGLPSLAIVEDGEIEDVVGVHDISFGPNAIPYVVIGLGADPDVRDEIGEDAEFFGHVLTLNVMAGTFTSLADVAQFEADEDPDADQGGHVDSNPYALLAEQDGIYVADAGGNSIVHVAYDGDVSLVAVLPFREVDVPPFFGAPPGAQMPMEPVPTDLVRGPDGALYISELTGFPFPPYSGRVYRLNTAAAQPTPQVYATGFTMATGLDFHGDQMFVTEFARDGVFVDEEDFAAGLTRVRTVGNNQRITAGGLLFATGIAVGPDDMVYVTNQGILPTASVIRFDPSRTGHAPIQDACAPEAITTWPLFDDVERSLHEESISCMYFWGIVQGLSPSTFGRADTLTRAQVASLLARLVDATDADLPEDAPDAFTDDDGSVHERNINRIAAAEIVHGRTSDLFAPGQPVTRGQLTAMLVRAYEYVTGEAPDSSGASFSDVPGTTHETAINAAAGAGWVSGFGDGTFRPNASVTREHAATMVARMLSDVVAAEDAEIPAG